MSVVPDRPDYDLPARPADSWRVFDSLNPDPGYGEFDWLSSRHPDLYNKFALTTVGLMAELAQIADLTDKIVVDVGAGTGRATLAAARVAKAIIAVDPYYSVVAFGLQQVREAALPNVTYVYGLGAHLPLRGESVDAVLCCWSRVACQEAFRVLRPRGYIFDMASAPGNVCGEMTPLLRDHPPPPREWFDLNCPVADSAADASMWGSIPLVDGVHLHDFTYQVDYGDSQEAAAIVGRLWGPTAAVYLTERDQATITWRLRIEYGQVKK